MSFFLDHPDFSLIPDPCGLWSWRGVAKTRHGLNALLTVWATPKDDPKHPLCVFSWQPTVDALEALHTHFPETHVRPIKGLLEHRAVSEAQNATAWVSAVSTPTQTPFWVHDGHAWQTHTVCSTPSVFPPVFLDGQGQPIAWDALVLWGLDSEDHVYLEQGPHAASWCFRTEEDADRFRQAVLACVRTPHHRARCLPLDWRAAYEHQTTRFWRTTEPWSDPTFDRTVHAFFDETTPTPWGVYQVETARFNRFRAIARTYSISTQRAAWHRAHPDGARGTEAALMGYAGPRFLAEKAQEGDAHATRALSEALHEALKKGDDVVFEEVKEALLHAPEWKTPEWDRYWGFRAQDTAEGLLRFEASFLAQNGVFAGPLCKALSPSMVSAFEDRAFLEALSPTFWEHIEGTSCRHPEWEALVEKKALMGLLAPPSKTPGLRWGAHDCAAVTRAFATGDPPHEASHQIQAGAPSAPKNAPPPPKAAPG
jgi:hypothetical protein